MDALCASESLAQLKQRAASNTLVYSKFIAIGLFRLLELAGTMEPAALTKLADAAGIPPLKVWTPCCLFPVATDVSPGVASQVNADLTLYRGLLSKLSAAKELIAEILNRERKKAAEREATKAGQIAPVV